MSPDLIMRDEKGEPQTVRYEAVNAMLLNEFFKEHKRVEDQARELRDQRTTIGELKENVATQTRIIAQQQNQMAALAEGLQKMSAQLELSKASPQKVHSQTTIKTKD